MTVSDESSNVFDFQQLQQVLIDWPRNTNALVDIAKFGNGIFHRIHQILLAASERGRPPNFYDLLPLIRQVALKRLYDGSSAKLKVSLGNEWPDRKYWKSFGFDCQDTVDHLVVTPTEWQPDWLRVSEDYQGDIFADCFKETEVGQNGEIPIDPFVGELTDYNTYVCPGQKEAVLSALFMPEGSTLIVNLPTGAGKTLVAQVPILMNGLNKGLSIFIVPTIALAIDQARRMKELLEQNHAGTEIPPLAWHSGLAEHEKNTIKNNIRQGRQGIIYASPEAVTGALRPSIYVAAMSGLLRYLIVDEAHLVAQWGDSFRPAFQTIAGLRRGLLECAVGAPFRTILMSATFSPECVETLDTLFGPPDKVQMVSAVHLRPEPRYWVAEPDGEDKKRDRVLDLLRHAPRPFILYVTKREDAESWRKILKAEAGYERVATFTGKTADHVREQIIHDWADNKLDGIIATSAFGVGIDKSDVRTIIHATVPESLDRFYQEVGRGGRDGKASLSITIYSPSDIGIARKMSTGDGFSWETAFLRWKAMFDGAKRDESIGDLREIDVRITASHIRQQTGFNEDWNMRTLILMARAGLIEISSTPPDTLERAEQEDDAAFEGRNDDHWADYYAKIPVKTLDGRHLDRDHFRDQIRVEQSRNYEAAEKSLNLLIDGLKGETEMCGAIARLYNSQKPGREILISKACRGCPAHGGTLPPEGLIYKIPSGIGISEIVPQRLDNWYEDFPENSDSLVIYYAVGSNRVNAELERALEVLVANYGVCEVVAPKEIWDSETSLRNLHKHATDKALIRRELEADKRPGSMIPLPRVTVLLPWGQTPIPENIEYLDRPIHAVLVPQDINAHYEHKRLIEISNNCISLEKFIERASR